LIFNSIGLLMSTFDAKGLKLAKTFKHSKGVKLVFEAPVAVLGAANVLCNTKIGAFTYFDSGRIRGLKVIGRYCSVANDVKIGDVNHPIDWLSTSGFQYNPDRFGWFSEDVRRLAEPFSPKVKNYAKKYVVIGHDVWIGAGSQIMRGVTIGSGAIIGAGSIVTKDVRPYEIVGGVPAARIRFRFPQSIIDRLLAISWWQYHATDLAGIDFSDIEVAISEIERRRDAGHLQPWEGEWRVLKDGEIFEPHELE
jgi:acetyltransferase-like isoleucine patch superfamily enzyme